MVPGLRVLLGDGSGGFAHASQPLHSFGPESFAFPGAWFSQCLSIAVGDVAFRQSPDYLSFVMVAGPTYLGAGILATHERREQFDTLLMLHGLFDQQGANQNGMF